MKVVFWNHTLATRCNTHHMDGWWVYFHIVCDPCLYAMLPWHWWTLIFFSCFVILCDPCVYGNQITSMNNTYNAPNISRPFVPKPDRWRLNRGSANHLTMILLESSEVGHFPPFMKHMNASVSLECWMLGCVVIGPGVHNSTICSGRLPAPRVHNSRLSCILGSQPFL